MGFKRKSLISVALSLAVSFAWAQDVSHLLDYTPEHDENSSVYNTFSVKFGAHSVSTTNEGDKFSSGNSISLGMGLQLLPILSLEAEASAWYPRGGEEHDFIFSGVSLGSNVVLHFPDVGPYAKFGVHCWVGNAMDTLDDWDTSSGCSDATGGGVLLKNNSYYYFFEINRTHYKQIDSWLLTAGVKF
ncbi:hypothetical protein ACU6U9_01375 [Pseudomonas sp. HK3]